MAIQVRRGNEKDFDAAKMLPGEFAVSLDTRYVRICYAPGVVVRMATYEAFEADMAQIKAILAESKDIYSAIQRIQSEVNAKADLVVEYAKSAEESAKNAKESEEKSKMYAENAEAVTGVGIATQTKAGLVKGGDNYIAEDGTLTLTMETTDKTMYNSHGGGIKVIEIGGKTEQKQYSGKNFINPTLETSTINGVTCTDNGDGTYTLNGTANNISYFRISTFTDLDLSKKYRLVGCPSDNSARGYHLYDDVNKTSDMSSDYGHGVTYQPTVQPRIYIYISKGTVCNNVVFKPMLVDATLYPNVTYNDFEPFTGNVPSPSPEYPQEIKSVKLKGVKTVGKNRVDLSDFEFNDSNYTHSRPINGTGKKLHDYFVDNIGKTVVVSMKTTGNSSGSISIGVIYAFDENDSLIARIYPNNIFVIPESIKNVYRYVIYGSTTGASVSDIQLEEDTVATEYEPYQESSITFTNTITLNDIGDAQDLIVRKDGVWDKNNKFVEVVFDGSADESWSVDSYGFRISQSALKVPETTKTNYICTHFIPISNSVSWNKYENWISNDKKNLYFYKGELTTVEEWKAKLQANPIKVLYELAEPTFEPLSTADQIALNSLLSFDGVTYLHFDSEIEPTSLVEYGTSHVGALTLEAWNKAENSRIKTEELTTALLMMNQS